MRNKGIIHIKYANSTPFFLVLLFFSTTLFFLLSFTFKQKGFLMQMGIPCVADFFWQIEGDLLARLLLIPMYLLTVAYVSRPQETPNYIVAFKSRIAFLLNWYLRAAIACIVITLIMVLLAVLMGSLFSNVLLNWDKYSSLYFHSIGSITNASYAQVVGVTALRIMLQLLFLTSLQISLETVIKNTFSFIITFLISAFAPMQAVINFIIKALGISTVSDGFVNSVMFFTMLFFYLLAIVLTIVFSCWKFKRKDFLSA
ncbi:MAG: hypothetical protein E7526_02875 [Ruminococcaceae bacterium]|nr:hypothetical protein [Oscillospiraceae bacterium]